MFRRIELINHFVHEGKDPWDSISGLMGIAKDEVADAWVEINAPRRRIGKNVRFFFTEQGWEKYGRATVAACQKTGQAYRVIAVEEHEMDVYYRDEYQVCLRPKRKRETRRRSHDL